jgi:hypothetical protein
VSEPLFPQFLDRPVAGWGKAMVGLSDTRRVRYLMRRSGNLSVLADVKILIGTAEYPK